jgi:hypothetical protein
MRRPTRGEAKPVMSSAQENPPSSAVGLARIDAAALAVTTAGV